MINTKPYVMNTKKPSPSRRLTFDMLPFGLGGIHLELLVRASFTSSTIRLAFGTFMYNNGEASCWM